MRRVCVWVAREWIDRAGKIKREKRADQSVKGVKPTDKWVVQWVDAGKRRLEKVDQLGRAGLEAAFARRTKIEKLLRNGQSVMHARDAAAAARSVAQTGSWAAFRKRFEANHLDSNPDLRASTAKLYRQSLDEFEKLCEPKLLTDVTTAQVADFRASMVKE